MEPAFVEASHFRRLKLTSRVTVAGHGTVDLEDNGIASGGSPDASDWIRSKLVTTVMLASGSVPWAAPAAPIPAAPPPTTMIRFAMSTSPGAGIIVSDGQYSFPIFDERDVRVNHAVLPHF